MPYTEADVAALNPALWIDPSLGNEVITYGTTASAWANVNYIVQRESSKRTRDGNNFYLTSYVDGRMPAVATKTCYFGSALTWIDYNGTNETSSTQGNTLRVTKNTSSSGTTATMDVQTGFIVQDSRRGGGTPFLDTVLAGGLVKARKAAQYTTAIYASGTSAKLTGSPVYLNGTQVNYGNGFTGAPEVFTFTATETVPVGFFAYLGNSENGARNGEEQSEILLFGSKLDDSSRSRVEAYLMKKWFGFVPEGFTDYSSATLDGAGTFTAANAAVAPKPAPTFAGTYAVGGESATFSMTIRADGTVVGALVAPNATLALPVTVVLNVSAADRLRAGNYVLVEAASLGETEFTLDGGLAGKANVELVRNGTAVILRKLGGLCVIFR